MLFAGVTFNLGGVDYTIPPLNLKSTKELQPQFEVIRMGKGEAGLTAAYVDAMLDIIYQAFVRNYPNVPRETLEGVVDLGNLKQLYLAVMGQPKPSEGEAHPPLEASPPQAIAKS